MSDDRDITEVLYDIKLKGTTEAYRQFGNLEKQIDQSLKSLQEMGEDDSLEGLNKRAHILTGTATNLARSLGTAHTGFNVLGKDGRQIEKLAKLTTDLTSDFRQLSDAQKEGNSELADTIRKRMQLREKELRMETQKGLKVLDKQKKRVQEIYDIRKKGLKGLAGGGARGGMDIFNALKGQDLGSALRSLGGGLKGGGLYAQGAGGERLSAARERLGKSGVQNFRDVKGGIRGQAANAMKAATSGVGGQYAMGQLLLTVGKLATAATAVVGIFALIAKVLYDAYAQAKRFNGEILKTQGITALMPTHMMGTAEGLALAEERLNKIRKLATDFEGNFTLDLKAEDMFALANALDEAGIPAKRLRDYASDLRTMLEADQIAAKNLGVGLNEVTSFTASYMDTLDADLSQVRDTLAYITDDAQKSGMSTKRFFQIIQNASGDMALYNYRISEASTLLRGISKYMDAKSAEDFMNNLGKGLTNMSQTDRLKNLALASGGNVGKFKDPLKKEARASLGDLSGDQRSEAIQRLQSMGIEVDNTTLDDVLLGLDTEKLGGLSGISGYRQIEKANLMNRNAGKGALGIAAAAGDAGPMFQVEALLKAAESVGSIENIDDVVGTQLVGGDEKRFRQMRSFAIQTRGQNARLQGAAKMGPEELDRVQKEMGFEGLSRSDKGELLGKDGKVIKNEFDLLRNLGGKQKDDLDKIQESQKSSAEKTVELTKNVLDAIELGMVKVLNDIYGVILDIREIMRSANPLAETDFEALKQKEILNIDDQIYQTRKGLGKAKSVEESKKIQQEIERLEASKSGPFSSVVEEGLSDLGGAAQASSDLWKNPLAKGALKDLYKDGKMTEDELKKIQEAQLQIMKDKGMKIDPASAAEIGRRVAIETQVSLEAGDFAKRTGLNHHMASNILRDALTTGTFREDRTDDKAGAVQRALEEKGIKATMLEPLAVPNAGDVRMATSGIPLLNMRAGDVVIDSASLAATGHGPAGSLLRATSAASQVAGASSSGGKGGSSVFAPVISLGQSDKSLQDKLLRLLEDFHRREILGSG